MTCLKISPNVELLDSEEIVPVVNKKIVIDWSSDEDHKSGLKYKASGVTLSASQSPEDSYKGENGTVQIM
jgi:hypothetical protein